MEPAKQDTAGAACFVSIEPLQGKAAAGRPDKHAAAEAAAGGGEDAQPGGTQLQPVPAEAMTLVAAADMYASEPKPATVAGGVLTVLALLAAIAYTVFQIVDYSRMPLALTSDVQWADTQGPFPATIRCTAPSGCWVSNRHNDRWSSNGDQVEAAQQGCLLLAAGDQKTLNITYTQNVLNGLVVVWDPTSWDAATTPGAGFVVLAETNYPAAPSGVFVLPTPVLGGVYLTSYVETHNHSAPAAKLRREWFVTYVSADRAVAPAATACAGRLSPGQLANYTQATIRMQPAWYHVTVDAPDLLLTLFGNCGGALQLCLQAGAILLLSYEFLRDKGPSWLRLAPRRRRRVHDDGQQHPPSEGGTSSSPAAASGHGHHGAQAPQPTFSLTGQVFVDGHTGRHFALLSPCHLAAANSSSSSRDGAQPACAQQQQQQQQPHHGQAGGGVLRQAGDALGRGLSWLDLSSNGGVATALRGLSMGGHRPHYQQQQAQAAGAGHHAAPASPLAGQHRHNVPGVLYLSSSSGGTK